jgi:glucosamine-6-phosphate deaminase
VAPVFHARFDDLSVEVHDTTAEMARAAAQAAAHQLVTTVQARGQAHAMFATGNSQLAFVDALTSGEFEVPWDRTTVFHMDEYLGVGADHPAGFARWIRERIVERVHPLGVHYVDGLAEGAQESNRYAALLSDFALDLCCLGIGENGHLAFNDPPVADFEDPLDVKVVELEPASRVQQVGEGHFADLDTVPTHAVTVTIPALLRARRVLAIVPEARKADPVRTSLQGPISTACPASVLRRYAHVTLFLDQGSAGLITWNEAGPP